MKNSNAIILFFVLSFRFILNSQTITYGGIFDKAYDQYGNEYALADLSLSSTKGIGNGHTINALPTISCSAGFFDLYYAPGSCFDGTTTAASEKRRVLCQVYTDLSNFINSPLSSISNTVRINMYCSNTPSNSPLTLGTAGAFYILPNNPSNPYPGIIDNQIQKAIISGKDPYANLAMSVFSGAANFYHGLVNAITSPSSGSWNYNLNTSTITSSEIDFYSIMLHEAIHSLGFGSLIDQTGFSKFGQNNNYYARYDLFLKDQSGNPLLAGTSASCSSSDLSFQVSTSLISPSCNTNIAVGITTCSTAIQYSSTNVPNISVYTPVCWSGGSSLSHFEDYCTTPSGYANSCSTTATPANSFNDLYYVMSDASHLGSCYLKRYIKPEERYVLCDLGYSVKTIYSSNTVTPVAMIDGTASSHSYSGSSCPGLNVWGQNDGLVNGAFTFTALSSATNAIALPITNSITANDATTTVGMSCIEVVYNNATYAIVGSSLVITTATGYNGLVLVKYLPVNSSGVFGNATYIYFYFFPGNCNPPNACNLVQNGGFESTNVFGQLVGFLGTLPSDAAVSCWDNNSGTPDVFRRNTFSPYNLGVNTFGLNPPVDSYNGNPNNSVIGIGGGNNGSESIKNNLSSPLTTGVTYQFSIWVLNHPTALINATTTPVVFSIGCLLNFASIGTPTALANFTVNTMGSGSIWAHYSASFTYTLPYNTNALVIEVDGAKTAALGYLDGNHTYYCFLDEVSLTAMPSPTFSIPNANICGNISFTNLAQYASPVPGIFSGTGVTISGTGTNTIYNFNAPGTNLPPGNYPVYFTYTTSSGCTNVIQENISIASIPIINASSSNIICSNLNVLSSTLSASCTSCAGATSFAWQPALITGTSIVVNPTITTIYTLTPIGGSCISTQTLAVFVQSLCCTQSVAAFATPSINSTFTLSTATAFNVDLTIPNGNWLSLSANEFLFAPNVKIIVNAGGVLRINGSHLYACTGNMWQGIVIKDGGQVYFQNTNGDNLVEDAITAIDITGPFISGSTNFDAHNTTFNKNYIGVNISAYTQTSTPFPFKIEKCVFTCRGLPFSSSNWPQTGTTSSATNTAADLRYVDVVSSPTTGLAPPYFNQGFAVVNLISPYSNQKSHIAINLNTVGITPGPAATTNGTASMLGITIGSMTASHFNLFDSHGSFIVANKSNVTLYNNVFQNTQTYTVSGGATFGGTAVKHSAVYTTTDVMHTILNMYGPSDSQGNRFWNCHKGIEIDKTYLFWLENAIFRSTQSTSNGSGFFPGDCGIFASTNNFDYYIANNEFTNVKQGINIPINTGLVAPKPSVNALPVIGIFAHRIRISNNTFSKTTSSSTLTNTYMDRAVDMTCPNSVPWQYSGVFIVPNVSVTPYTQAFSVKNNLIADAFNGISINGSHGFQVDISENDVFLKDNGTQQFGIALNNCLPTSSNLIGKNIVSQNTASFSAAPSSSTSNQSSLIFCGDNGFGVSSPSVSCNELTQSYNGFVFDGENKNAVWGGNKMSIPINQAFVLSHNAAIGTQGGTNTAIANQWVGGSTSWVGTNYGSWTASGSQATNSILYVSAVSSYSPDNNFGSFILGAYVSGIGFHANPSGGTYVCGDFPNHKVKMPLESEYDSEIPYYRAKNALYRFVHYNDSVRNSDVDIANFYADQSGTSIDKFMQVEEKLYMNQVEEATSILSDIDDSDFNIIETNYRAFYNLYIAYLSLNVGEPYGAADSTDLKTLAELCPGTNGPVIYQAMSLYNTIYGEILTSDCSESESRPANTTTKNTIVNKNRELNIYPNPTSNSLNITTNIETENLLITIFDLSGREVFTGHLKTKNFMGKLDFDLINGAYFITIRNSNEKKETITKKLLIAK